MSQPPDPPISVSSTASHNDRPISRSRRRMIAQLLPAILLSLEPTLTAHERNKRHLERLGLLHLQTLDNNIHPAVNDNEHLQNMSSGRYVSSIHHLFSDSSMFYQITRMTITEFLMFHSQLMPELAASRSTGETQPHSHPRLTTYEQLLLWFMYCDTGNSVIISLLFGNIHPRSVDNYAQHVTNTLLLVLSDEIHWPDAQERQSLYGLFSVYDKAIAVMDGTHCEIRVPTVDETEFYSGYKKMHTQNFLFAVNVYGLVIYFEGPYAGRYNDRGIYNQCSLATNTSAYLSEGERIIADGGFIGGLPLLTPATKTDMRSATTEDEKNKLRLYTEELSLNRSLVEHIIHSIKDRARLLTMRWPKSLDKQGQYIKAAVCVHNWLRFVRIQAAVNTNIT
jgi:hypothetical protein